MDIRRTFYFILFGIIFNTTIAANSNCYSKINWNECDNYIAFIDYQNMRSTHATYFNGGSLTINYKITESFLAGVGTEFSYSRFHHDNQWNLHNLKLIPVFLDFRLNLFSGRTTPFIHSSEGISFNSYRREYILDLGNFSNFSERGFYLYVGTGVSLKIFDFMNSMIELGFKGYHMSFNDLDINPHGMTIRVGLSIKL